jgi:hypothetical protein
MVRAEELRSTPRATATIQLFNRKTARANAYSGPTNVSTGPYTGARGLRPESLKNKSEAAKTDAASAPTLKRTRWGVRSRGTSLRDMTRASTAAVSVPAAGPYRRVDRNTVGSDKESRTTKPGIFTVYAPMSAVAAVRMNQPAVGGLKAVSLRDQPTSATPRTGMALR